MSDETPLQLEQVVYYQVRAPVRAEGFPVYSTLYRAVHLATDKAPGAWRRDPSYTVRLHPARVDDLLSYLCAREDFFPPIGWVSLRDSKVGPASVVADRNVPEDVLMLETDREVTPVPYVPKGGPPW